METPIETPPPRLGLSSPPRLAYPPRRHLWRHLWETYRETYRETYQEPYRATPLSASKAARATEAAACCCCRGAKGPPSSSSGVDVINCTACLHTLPAFSVCWRVALGRCKSSSSW